MVSAFRPFPARVTRGITLCHETDAFPAETLRRLAARAIVLFCHRQFHQVALFDGRGGQLVIGRSYLPCFFSLEVIRALSLFVH